MRRLLVLTMCFMFAGTVRSFAEPLQEKSWEAGTEISHIKYEEPGVMKEEGIMYGLLCSYSYHNICMLRAEGRFSCGQVDYENSGTMNNVDDYVWEFRGLAGYDFPVSETSTFTPYIGVGYRYLNDDSGGMTTSTGAKGYERESNYFYSPIGIEAMTALGNRWSIGIVLEYDYFWKGVQKSHLSDADSSYSDLENDQNDGYGLRGSIKFQKKGDKVDFVIEPFVRYWDIDKSEEENVTYSGVIVGYGYEPENDSTEYGIKFAAKF